MMQSELIGLLSAPFYDNFADTVAARVCDDDALELLYGLVTAPPPDLSRAVRHKVFFRGAYVLERIYFGAPSRFAPFAGQFCCVDFAACTDLSARRHFGKIMAHLLDRYTPPLECLEQIAEAAGGWAVGEKTPAAVRIWAVEVLRHCRGKVAWVAESWDDILGMMAQDAPPSIRCRLRKNWK